MDRTLASRVGVANESELNVREDVDEGDEEEFFRGASEVVEENGGGGREEEEEQQMDEKSGTSFINEPGMSEQPESNSQNGDKENYCHSLSMALPGRQPFSGFSAASSRPYASNLSKITEVPDEFSFSFKQGENAIQLFNRDREELRKQNYLRLPSMSFHTSNYSMKYTWEESALRHHNASVTFARSELDLSLTQAPVKNSLRSVPDKPAPPFLSGTRHYIYFGFCRQGFESEQALLVRNIHPNKERVQIRCSWSRAQKEKYFKILHSEGQEHCQVLGWDQVARIIVGFTPPEEECSYYKNFLKIGCYSRKEEREYFFLVHGYGGRAVLEPIPEGRSASLCFSANGQYQLIVRSASKFHFALKNSGPRSAFASLLFYYPNGVEVDPREIIANMRNLLLSKEGLPEPCTKAIEIRYLGAINSPPSGSGRTVVSDSGREIALKIAIIWGEEKQRQRLKQFEKKEITAFGGELQNFGQNFTVKRNFDGETVELNEPNISEEEYYCFDKQTRVTFVNIIERAQASSAVEKLASSTGPSYQARAGSALSVVSGGTADERRELRAHQTIVEMDPDNTLTMAGGTNALDNDTLT